VAYRLFDEAGQGPELTEQEKQWVAVYTRSRHEKKVAARLMDKAIEHYLPLVERVSQWQDRKKIVAEPLLSGYIFVHCTAAQKLDILQTAGVVQFVKIAGQVAVIPAWQIEALQIFVATYADEIRHEDYRKYRVGDEVIVVAGPLKGIKGRIIAGGRHVRFAVGIDQVRSAFSVTVDVDLIEKLVDKRVTRPE
jgi:transcription antitermination factor NusG